MIEKLIFNEMNIPYGLLHDQKLLSVRQEKSKLIFSFDIKLYEQNYFDEEIFNKYSEYNRCDMEIETNDEPFNYIYLETAIDRHGRFKGISLNRDDFISTMNDCEADFVGCTADSCKFKLEMSVNFYNSKEYKKLKKYCMLNAEFDCINEIVWHWYNE